MTTQRTWLLIAAGVTVSSAVTLIVERVRAAGIPEEGTLTYTGHLENPDGTPVNGEKNIALQVFNAEVDGEKVCEVPSDEIEITSGRFQVPLPDECTQAVKDNPGLWVNVEVAGSPIGRTQLGAVPYAVEAANAGNAVGGLRDELDTMQGKLVVATEWEAYTPTLIHGDNGAAVTNQTTTGRWRRVGDTVELQLYTAFTGSPAASTWYKWGLPSGVEIDAAKLTNGGQSLGYGRVYNGAGHTVTAWGRTSGADGVVAADEGDTFVGDGGVWPMSNGSVITLRVTFPVVGWTTGM